MPEQKKSKNKLNSRDKIALTGAILLVSYVAAHAGGDYYIKKTSGFQHGQKGYYNRQMDKQFVNEFLTELNHLDIFYQARKAETKGKNRVTIDILVEPSVKLFYDDAKNKGDNDSWSDQVRNALKGLAYFREYRDLEFVVNTVKPLLPDQFTTSPVVWQDPYLETKKIFDYIFFTKSPSSSDITITFLGGKEGREYLGIANYINGDACIVSLTTFDDLNKNVLAHEVGHLFGAKHQGFLAYIFLCTPSFGTITYGMDIMTSGSNVLVENWSKANKTVIEKNKYKFNPEPKKKESQNFFYEETSPLVCITTTP